PAARGQVQKLRHGREVPITVTHMNVTEIGGQFRQARLDIGIGLIPVQQGANGKVMPQIMDTWSAPITGFAQANLTGHQKEPAIYAVINQAVSAFPGEEARTLRLRINAVPDAGISSKRNDGRG